MRLILNGKSADNPTVRQAVQDCRENGIDLEVCVTWEGGDAGRMAAKAVDEGVDRLIAGGGDGTINEIVNGILAATETPKIALGVLPLGTANDFANGCSIPTSNLSDALDLAVTGDPTLIDVGRINDRHFINVASAGFGAEVTVSTPKPMKRALGGAAYAIMGFLTALKMKPYEGTLRWRDGEQSGAMLVAAIGNGRQAGGGFQLTPRALLNDGLLDVMAVPDFSPDDLGTIMNDLSNLQETPPQLMTYLQLDHCEIECSRPVPLNLDGEPMLEKSYTIQVLHKRLPMILPPESPLEN